MRKFLLFVAFTMPCMITVPCAGQEYLPVSSEIMDDFTRTNVSQLWYPLFSEKRLPDMEKHFSENILTPDDIDAMHLQVVKHPFLRTAVPEQIIKGETLYDGDSGRVVMVHAINNIDGETGYLYDYVMTYDREGNYVDSQMVGETEVGRSGLSPSIQYWINNDGIHSREINEGETIPRSYYITPRMAILGK